LREVTVDGTRTYFDTNTGDHHHFYCEDDGMLLDIDGMRSKWQACLHRRMAPESTGSM